MDEVAKRYLEIIQNAIHPYHEERWDTLRQWVDLQGREAIPLLKTLLYDHDSTVRVISITQLAQWLDEEIIHLLIDMLDDDEDLVRENAQEALQQGGATTIDILLSRLNTENARIRYGIARTFWAFPVRRVVETLIMLLQDSDEDVRKNAALSLGICGDVEAVPHLIRSLNDTASGVRYRAVEALGDLTDGRAYEPLVAHLDTATLRHKYLVIKSIGNLGQPAAVPLLIRIAGDPGEPEYHREEALKALLNMGTAGILALEHFKAEGDRFARKNARRLLEEFTYY
jgi:HEAT repeat protein